MFYRKNRRPFSKAQRLIVIIILLGLAIIGVVFYINAKIMPVYLQYAEAQTEKIASYVVGKAINARTTGVLDVNTIIEDEQFGDDAQPSIEVPVPLE